MTKYIISILVALSSMSTDERAYASCGAASCPLNSFSPLRGGWLQFGLAYEYINQDRIFLGSSESYPGAIPEVHDELRTINRRTLFHAQYGLFDGLGLEVHVPFINREHSHIAHDAEGDKVESWAFSAVGDVIINGQYALLVPPEEFEPYLSVVAGIKLPTGATHEVNSGGEEAEVTIQPGTGSTDAFFGLNYQQTLASLPMLSGKYSALPIIANITFQLPGHGTHDYRFGNSLLAHVGTAYRFSNFTSILLQVNGKVQDYADVGTTGEPRENTGGTWIFLSPGLGLHISDAFVGNAYLQIPLYQNVHGIQQTAAYNLAFNLTYSLSLVGAD